MERQLRANRGKNPNARWLVEDIKPVKRKQKAQEPVLEEWELKCKCNGTVPDTVLMTECEQCKSWQHNVCVFGLNAQYVVPVPYVCIYCTNTPQRQLNEVCDTETDLAAKEAAVEISQLHNKEIKIDGLNGAEFRAEFRRKMTN